MPAKFSDPTPQLEAMRLAAAAQPANMSVAGPDSNIWDTPIQRWIAAAQASACTVEPMAIAQAMTRLVQLKPVSAVVSATARLTSTDPAAMPGQTRDPHIRTAASAMPDGGQTA